MYLFVAFEHELQSAYKKLESVEEMNRIAAFKYFNEKQQLVDEISKLKYALERQVEHETLEKKMLERRIMEMFGVNEPEPMVTVTKKETPIKKSNVSKDVNPLPLESTVSNTTSATNGILATTATATATNNPIKSTPEHKHPPQSPRSGSKSTHSNHMKTQPSNSIMNHSVSTPSISSNDTLMNALLKAQKQTKKIQEEIVTAAREQKAAEPKHEFKRPLRDCSTQTVFDHSFSPIDNEDAFFDIHDGWVLPIDNSIIARMRWRKAYAFAKCPFCRGIGSSVAKTALLLRQCQFGDINYFNKITKYDEFALPNYNYTDEEFNRRQYYIYTQQSIKKSNWKSAEGLWGQFLVHIPRVMGMKPNVIPMKYVISRLLNILTYRQVYQYRIEKQVRSWNRLWVDYPTYAPVTHPIPPIIEQYCRHNEVRLGIYEHVDDFNAFIINTYMLCTISKLDAEKQLYLLITAMKDCYKSNSLIQLVSRLMSLLDGPQRNYITEDNLSVLEQEYSNWNIVDIITHVIPPESEVRIQTKLDVFNDRQSTSSIQVSNSNTNVEVDKKGRNSSVTEKDPLKSSTVKDKLLHHEYKDAFPISDTSLSNEYLLLYLYVRECCYIPYTGVYKSAIDNAKRIQKSYKQTELDIVQGSLHMDESVQHAERGKHVPGSSSAKSHPGVHTKAYKWHINGERSF